MGRLPCCAAFKLNGHDAMGKEANGRKNSQTDAQGAVREGQDGGLPDRWTHPKAEAGKRQDLFNKRHEPFKANLALGGERGEGGW